MNNIYYIIIFVLIGVLFIVKNNAYLKIIKKEKEKIKKIPSQINYFNLGNSHSKCMFSSLYLKKDFFDFSYDSQTFYYDLKMLEKYSKNIAEGSVCFFPISYFSFYSKQYWQKNDQFKYYQIFTKDELNTNVVEYLLKRRIPYLFFMFWKFKKIFRKRYPKVSRAQNHKRLIVQNTKEVYSNEFIVKKIISILKDKKIKVILISPPLKKEYKKEFTEHFLEENYYRILRKYIDNSEIFYLNLTNFLLDENKYFIDQDHLNNEGSKKVVEYILEKKIWDKNE